MVDNFFVQWSNVAFIIVEHCQYCRFKKQLGFIFLVLTTIQTMVDNFLCNGVMLLLLLLNIVNIVVLKNNLALYF